MVIEMVKGYKTINIKEEVVEKIRNYEENKEEIEQNRFNLAGFVSRVLLEYMNKEKTDKEQKKEGLTIDQIKNAVKEVTNQRGEETFNGTTYNGLTEEDLRSIKEVVAEAISEAMNTH